MFIYISLYFCQDKAITLDNKIYLSVKMKSSLLNHQRQKSTIVDQPSVFFKDNYKKSSESPLPKQQEFFPVLNLKKINPLKMKEIYLIKQRQRRQGVGLLKKLAYKQLIQNQKKQNQSLQKYQQIRRQRYGKLSNISYINVNERIQHQNRFSTVNISGQQKNMNNKKKNHKLIQSNRNQFERYQENSLRYLLKQLSDGQEQKSNNPQDLKQNFRKHRKYVKAKAIDNSNQMHTGATSIQQQKRIKEQLKLLQKDRINNMILKYRQYQQEQLGSLKYKKGMQNKL